MPNLTSASAFAELERRFGALTRLDSGMQGRIYLTPHDEVLKVYRNQSGEHVREAQNMRQAGLGEWVGGTLEVGGLEVLMMRRFYGSPMTALQLPQALSALRQQLRGIHQQSRGRVDTSIPRRRLRQFRTALAAYPLAEFFDAAELPLEEGLFDQPAVFCHLDLWHDNILVSATSEVLIIDWNKAAWDDPLRDLALLKTGTLDLLPAADSLHAALSFLPDQAPTTLRRYAAYLALTTLHDLYWFLMNEPYHFDVQYEKKVKRTRHALLGLHWLESKQRLQK